MKNFILEFTIEYHRNNKFLSVGKNHYAFLIMHYELTQIV